MTTAVLNAVADWKAFAESQRAEHQQWLSERMRWKRERNYRPWFPDTWATRAPSEKVAMILARVSRNRALEITEYVEVVARASRKYSRNPQNTARAFRAELGVTPELHDCGYFFRGELVSPRRSWERAAEDASMQAREWWTLDRRNGQREWALDEWDRAVQMRWLLPEKSLCMLPEPCPCGSPRGFKGWTRAAKRTDDNKELCLCWTCWLKYRRQEKRERELAGLSREINRLKKEIGNGRKNQHDRRAA
jgi:hypothetical protein